MNLPLQRSFHATFNGSNVQGKRIVVHLHPLRSLSSSANYLVARQRPLASFQPQSVPSNDNGSPIKDQNSASANSDTDADIKIDLELPRRTRLVSFTCNICGGRTERLVNPIAWERGMVIIQCESCQAWHKVADPANLVEEIRYTDLENSDLE